MRMTSTGALRRALAAARPPKPPPTITTRAVFDVCSSAPLIELRLASFIHPFLKLLRPEISENLGFLADRDGQVSGEQTAAYQASQKLISRIRISVVMPNHGMRTTSTLTWRTAGMSLSTLGSRLKNRWRLRKKYAPPAK